MTGIKDIVFALFVCFLLLPNVFLLWKVMTEDKRCIPDWEKLWYFAGSMIIQAFAVIFLLTIYFKIK